MALVLEREEVVTQELRLRGLMQEVGDEMKRAVKKFPLWPSDPIHAAAVVQEEAGELVQAANECCWEPGKCTRAEMRQEAVQVAAMAFRFLLSFERYEFKAGAQHEQ